MWLIGSAVRRAQELRERVDQLGADASRAQSELHAAIADLAADGASLRELPSPSTSATNGYIRSSTRMERRS